MGIAQLAAAGLASAALRRRRRTFAKYPPVRIAINSRDPNWGPIATYPITFLHITPLFGSRLWIAIQFRGYFVKFEIKYLQKPLIRTVRLRRFTDGRRRRPPLLPISLPA
jgi:hypothetical protein